MKYAVLEWDASEDHVDGWARVISRDQDKVTADWLVRITPQHLSREVITMEEYEGMLDRR